MDLIYCKVLPGVHFIALQSFIEYNFIFRARRGLGRVVRHTSGDRSGKGLVRRGMGGMPRVLV